MCNHCGCRGAEDFEANPYGDYHKRDFYTVMSGKSEDYNFAQVHDTFDDKNDAYDEANRLSKFTKGEYIFVFDPRSIEPYVIEPQDKDAETFEAQIVGSGNSGSNLAYVIIKDDDGKTTAIVDVMTEGRSGKGFDVSIKSPTNELGEDGEETLIRFDDRGVFDVIERLMAEDFEAEHWEQTSDASYMGDRRDLYSVRLDSGRIIRDLTEREANALCSIKEAEEFGAEMNSPTPVEGVDYMNVSGHSGFEEDEGEREKLRLAQEMGMRFSKKHPVWGFYRNEASNGEYRLTFNNRMVNIPLASGLRNTDMQQIVEDLNAINNRNIYTLINHLANKANNHPSLIWKSEEFDADHPEHSIKGKVRTMSGKPHSPRKMMKDMNISPEEAAKKMKLEADMDLKESAKVGFGFIAGLTAFRVAAFGVAAIAGRLLGNNNNS